MKCKTLLLLFLVFILLGSQSFAVSIYLSNGMKIQTWVGTAPSDSSGFGRIVVDGDVYDAPNPSYSGELLGKVSCSNASATTFAGLTLPGAAGGTITRLDAISCAHNAAAANFTRWFVVKNNGSAQNGTITFAYKNSNTNSVTPPYVIGRWNGTAWTNYTPNSSSSPITANGAQVPGGITSLWIAVHDVMSDIYRIYAKVWLEGSYSASANKMVQKQIYSLPDPGSGYPYAILDTLKRDWTVGFLTQDVTTPLTTALPSVVDLVHVMVRSTASGSMLAEGKGLVNTDGYLYGLDGTPGVPLNINSQNYYIVILHHNHLPVMSNRAVQPSEMTGYPAAYWDFTVLNNCYPKPNPWINNEPLKQIDSSPVTYGLWGGNAGDEGGWERGITSDIPVVVYADDEPPIRAINFLERYARGDTDMNGIGVWADDVTLIYLNNFYGTEVPFPLKP